MESNNALGWRDYQEIMALTALTGSLETGLGKVFLLNGAANQPLNGAGIKSNQDYGFGLADAFGAVRLAESWDGPVRTSANEVDATSSASPNALIPDGGELNSIITLSSSQPLRLMHVVVSLQIVSVQNRPRSMPTTMPYLALKHATDWLTRAALFLCAGAPSNWRSNHHHHLSQRHFGHAWKSVAVPFRCRRPARLWYAE